MLRVLSRPTGLALLVLGFAIGLFTARTVYGPPPGFGYDPNFPDEVAVEASDAARTQMYYCALYEAYQSDYYWTAASYSYYANDLAHVGYSGGPDYAGYFYAAGDYHLTAYLYLAYLYGQYGSEFTLYAIYTEIDACIDCYDAYTFYLGIE